MLCKVTNKNFPINLHNMIIIMGWKKIFLQHQKHYVKESHTMEIHAKLGYSKRYL